MTSLLGEATKQNNKEWAIVLILLVTSVVLSAVSVVFLLLEGDATFTYPNLLLWIALMSAGTLLSLVALLLSSYYRTRAEVRTQLALDDALSKRRRTY